MYNIANYEKESVGSIADDKTHDCKPSLLFCSIIIWHKPTS